MIILDLHCVKGLKDTKTFKQIKCEGVCGQLEARNCFQRQLFIKYLRQTPVFMWNSALRENSYSVVQEISTTTSQA